jgi:flagellar protein FliS
MDVGGAPAEMLSEFYASIFAQILHGSQSASRSKFEHAIACVRNVRDAWRQVAQDKNANLAPALTQMPLPRADEETVATASGSMSWNA